MTDEPTSESSPEGTLPPPHAEAPTEPIESVPVEEPTEAAPVTTTTTSTTEPPRRKGVLVPVWALVTVAGLLLLAAGGLVGYAIGSNDDGGDGRSVRAGGFQLPERLAPPGFGQFPNGNGPNGNGQNGNGRNGNGGGNNDGNGNGGSTTDNGAFLGVAVQDSTNPRGAELV